MSLNQTLTAVLDAEEEYQALQEDRMRILTRFNAAIREHRKQILASLMSADPHELAFAQQEAERFNVTAPNKAKAA